MRDTYALTMSSSSRHPLVSTTAQRDANWRYSQQLTKLQDEIMDLNKAIEEMAAEHRRQLTPPRLLLLLTYARRNLNTSSSDDMS